MVRKLLNRLIILGDDGVPVEYHVIFWKSELIDFVILQQDAFDEVDSVTPMERQEEILNMVIDICHTEFKFDTFIEVMDYFKKMINLCRKSLETVVSLLKQVAFIMFIISQPCSLELCLYKVKRGNFGITVQK